MYRNVTKSVKVNKDLLEKFEKIVEERTTRIDYNGRVHYYSQLNKNGIYGSIRGKFTLADLLERSLRSFIEENSVQK